MIAFGYPIVLIIVCTIYAVLTRKIPEAFNESKHIGMFCLAVFTLKFFLETLDIFFYGNLPVSTVTLKQQ